jgi:hypothetical protein
MMLTFSLLEGLHRQVVEAMGDLDKYFSTNFSLQLSCEELQANLFSLMDQVLQMQDEVIVRELRQSMVNLLNLVISLAS